MSREDAVTARTRLVAGLTAVFVLLAAGVFVSFRMAVDSFNRAIPQADLFGIALPGPTPDGSPTPAPGPPPPPPGASIKGPLNILIAGDDTRELEPGSLPHADAVMVMHINADLTHAYIASLPRDMLVNVPAFAPSGSGADFTKLTHALIYGSRVPGTGDYDTRQGFALLAETVSGFTGIDHFDAGALVTFIGMERLADSMGGVDMYVDTYVESIHLNPNGGERQWCPSCPNQYTGPSATYPVGMMHMAGWQVLDYARQRYNLPGGAYARERHHRQIIKAMIARLVSFDLMTHAFVLPYVLRAVGQMLTLDLRGRQLDDYVYALRNLRPESITLVGLPGSAVGGGGGYLGEALAPIQAEYFAAVRNDTTGDFLNAHPELVNDPR
jgi:anionic cell wall polymer biosynthesis LytR-Cps2A-Psr (LCP) family protein